MFLNNKKISLLFKLQRLTSLKHQRFKYSTPDMPYMENPSLASQLDKHQPLSGRLVFYSQSNHYIHQLLIKSIYRDLQVHQFIVCQILHSFQVFLFVYIYYLFKHINVHLKGRSALPSFFSSCLLFKSWSQSQIFKS